jgi:hypothetical protein
MYFPCTDTHSGPNMWHPGLLFANAGSEPHILTADFNRTALTAANNGPGDRTNKFTASELRLPAAVFS